MFNPLTFGLLWSILLPSLYVGLVAAVDPDSNDSLAIVFNNFLLDFAPIVSLFGDQPSKQFLGQSLGWADNIIFAVAPLGILLIVTSAIRAASIPHWLSFIGYARES